MGIREEIDELETYPHRIFSYEWETISKDTVLFILDKWECLTEYTNEDEAVKLLCIGTEDGLTEEPLMVCPGDRIIIWRRKDED